MTRILAEVLPSVFKRPSRLRCRHGWDANTTEAFETLEFESLELICDLKESIKIPALSEKASRIEKIEIRVRGELCGIEQFTALSSIDLPIGAPRNGISLSTFTRLRALSAQWSDLVAQEIDGCAGLSSLGVLGWNRENLEILSNFSHLAEISFSQGKLRSLKGLKNPGGVQSLGLAYLREFFDLGSITNLSALRSIDVENLPRLEGDLLVRNFNDLRSIRVVSSAVGLDLEGVEKLHFLTSIMANGAVFKLDLPAVLSIETIRVLSLPVGEGATGLEDRLLSLAEATGKSVERFALVGPKKRKILQLVFSSES
jgi:hypothetical protein